MTRYYTKVAAALVEQWSKNWSTKELAAGWPEGLRIVEVGPVSEHGWHTVEFEDDGAPADLEGRMVTPVIGPDLHGRMVIVGRTVDPF